MTLKKRILAPALAAATFSSAAVLLGGCAVSQGDVDHAYHEAEATIQANSGGALNPMPLVEHVPTAFIGNQAVPLSYDATLPAVFREKTLTFPPNLTLSAIAQLVSGVTGYPVHLSPDVFMSPDLFTPQAGGKAAPGGAGATATHGLTDRHTDPVYAEPCPDCTVGHYLQAVTDNLGLDWAFDGTTISVSRFVTRTFMIAAVPGAVTLKSDLTKGTDAATGAQAAGGGATSTSNGAFSATTKSARSGSYDYMASIRQELEDLKSPLGKVELNPQTRLVMVHDTKENVERMATVLERENAIATREVALRVRTIQVALNDNTQRGVSTNAVFSLIQQGLAKYSVSFAAPTSLTTATGGTVGLSVLQQNAPWSGTNAVLQALNGYGRTVEDDTQTKVTLNGVPVTVASYETKGYLAATTPSVGSLSGSTAGVPGLTPGSVTVGKVINILPSVNDHNQILLSYWNDASQLNGPFTTIGAGTGATAQQIQLPDITGLKDDQTVSLADGQTMVLYGEMDNHFDSSSNAGIAGASGNLNHGRTFQIVMLTATVVPSGGR